MNSIELLKKIITKAKSIAPRDVYFYKKELLPFLDDLLSEAENYPISSISSSLSERSKKIELLEAYSKFLQKGDYMDTDWKDEEPFAIDVFLKEL